MDAHVKNDEQMWAVFCHLGGLFGILMFPANIIVPFIIWLVYRDQYPRVDDEGREAINWQISFTLYLIGSAILVLIAVGLFMVLGLLVINLVVTIQAALAVSQGRQASYPMTIRFL
ncbi:DUF4870 domain-containing protein [candidate division KSB1 bacterium]|nr:DUF4870 domain-containing protein [candidate division KSB1 bacterium]